MSNIDNFKKFVNNHTELIDYVKKNKISWQSLYETYDLYGEDNKIWSKYIREEKELVDVKGLLNIIKNINLDSLEENISSIQKAVGLVEELTRPSDNKEEVKPKEEKLEKIYGEDNEK